MSIHAIGSGHAKIILLWRHYRKWAAEERIPLELTVRRRRGRRSSASFAIHDISGIPGSPMDRVKEFASWRGPRRGPKSFPLHIWPDTPSLRELVASTAPPGSHDPRSGVTPVIRVRLLMDETGCPPGISLLSGMPNMAVPILIFAGPVAVSVRLLPFHRIGCLRNLRNPPGSCGGCGGCGGCGAIPRIISPGLPGVPPDIVLSLAIRSVLSSR